MYLQNIKVVKSSLGQTILYEYSMRSCKENFLRFRSALMDHNNDLLSQLWLHSLVGKTTVLVSQGSNPVEA